MLTRYNYNNIEQSIKNFLLVNMNSRGKFWLLISKMNCSIKEKALFVVVSKF